MILDESLFEDNISEEKNRKIQIFGDGEYLFTTDNYSTIKDVVKEFKDRGEFTVASLPKDRKVKFSDYKKVTGKFKEDLDERVDEYLQYDAKRDEDDEEEFYDDEFLFDEEEQEKVKEDMTLPAVSDEEIAKTEESPSEMVEANAYSNAIIDALNDEWATVQKYQDIVNQLSEHEEFKQFIPVIEDIIKDEKNHVGNLQKVLNDINPTTLPDIKDGEHEAEEQMGEKAVDNKEENE